MISIDLPAILKAETMRIRERGEHPQYARKRLVEAIIDAGSIEYKGVELKISTRHPNLGGVMLYVLCPSCQRRALRIVKSKCRGCSKLDRHKKHDLVSQILADMKKIKASPNPNQTELTRLRDRINRLSGKLEKKSA